MRTLPRGTSKTPLAPLDDTQYGMPKGVSPSSSAALPPNTPTPFFVQQCGMRLQQPDDELGSSVFLALPCILVHRIDAFSPLHPDFDSRHRTRRVDHRSTGSQHHPDGLRSRRFSRTEATVSTQYRFPSQYFWVGPLHRADWECLRIAAPQWAVVMFEAICCDGACDGVHVHVQELSSARSTVKLAVETQSLAQCVAILFPRRWVLNILHTVRNLAAA